MDWDICVAEQVGEAFDVVIGEAASHVVGVMMGDEDAGEAHAVDAEQREEIADGPRWVDDHRLAGRAVADHVDLIGHLGGSLVAYRDIAPTQQLAKVEPVVEHPLIVGPAAVLRA